MVLTESEVADVAGVDEEVGAEQLAEAAPGPAEGQRGVQVERGRPVHLKRHGTGPTVGSGTLNQRLRAVPAQDAYDISSEC